MEQKLATYFETRPRSAFETRQKEQILYFFSLITLSLSLSLAVLNFLGGANLHALSLVTLSVLCIPLLVLIRTRRYYYTSALLFTLVSMLAVTINIAISGTINDSGIVAYPIVVVSATFLQGRRAALISVLLASASLLAIFLFFVLSDRVSGQDIHFLYMEFATIVMLLCCSAFVAWIIIKNDETNLQMVMSSREELNQSYNQTLESWAKVLEYRDRETEGHCQRVRLLSEWMARKLDLTEKEVRNIGYGALLHDIGKLAIPDSILLKNGALTQEERLIMDKHTEYAHEFLSQIPFLQESIPVAYSHHERWDGNGYPQGLKGENIPIVARIFTVVDQWEALTSDRPYRKAWTEAQAIAYLEKNRGTVFDPRIADVFLDAFRNGELPISRKQGA